MALAALAHDLDQVLVGQDGGGAQNLFGDLDLVVGETADQAVGGVGSLGETGGQFGADRDLHLGRQLGQHRAVERGFIGVGRRRAKEVGRQFAQQQTTLFAGLLAGQGDEFGQARALDLGRFDHGAIAHGRLSASVCGTARKLPLALRIRAGGPSGWARSLDCGVWAIWTGMASR